jgi:hypothetical protein
MDGNRLCAGPNGIVVGSYQHGVWTVGQSVFLIITPEAPTKIQFEEDGSNCSGEHGPFENVQLVDGAIRHGPKLSEVLARFDEKSQSWYIYADQKNCPSAILSSA